MSVRLVRPNTDGSNRGIGVPRHIRSGHGPEFVAKDMRSGNSNLSDEFLNGKIFYSIQELRVLPERWRAFYYTIKPQSALGCQLPAQQA